MSLPEAGGMFERHHLAVFRFLRRMCGSAGRAEDLTQEVFLRVVRGLGAYEDRARERSWVFRIARNVLLDDWRQRERRGDDVLDSTEQGGRAFARPPTQDLATALTQALHGLPEEDREAFLMREIGGLGYDEIAEAAGITRDAARMRIYRARKALRLALSPATPAKGLAPALEA